MINCIFCKSDKSKIENKIIEETENFVVTPSLGSLVEGYILIISKKHIHSMSELSDEEKIEYFNLIDKYRNKFNSIYGKMPIVFEHGSSYRKDNHSASSVIHAHTHIVNHNYIKETTLIKAMNFKNRTELKYKNKDYVFYISPDGTSYLTYNFKHISQLMRIEIAKDLGLEDKYNWRDNPFIENVIATIEEMTIK